MRRTTWRAGEARGLQAGVDVGEDLLRLRRGILGNRCRPGRIPSCPDTNSSRLGTVDLHHMVVAAERRAGRRRGSGGADPCRARPRLVRRAPVMPCPDRAWERPPGVGPWRCGCPAGGRIWPAPSSRRSTRKRRWRSCRWARSSSTGRICRWRSTPASTRRSCARALELMPAGLPVLVLPTTAVGKSNEHIDFPGHAHPVGRDPGPRLVRDRRLRPPGGRAQAAPVQQPWRPAAGDADRGARAADRPPDAGGRRQLVLVGRCRTGCSTPPSCATASMPGTVETAMMLAVRPDLVDMAAAADFVPVTVADDVDYPRLRALGAAGLGWQAQDLHRRGRVRRRDQGHGRGRPGGDRSRRAEPGGAAAGAGALSARQIAAGPQQRIDLSATGNLVPTSR